MGMRRHIEGKSPGSGRELHEGGETTICLGVARYGRLPIKLLAS